METIDVSDTDSEASGDEHKRVSDTESEASGDDSGAEEEHAAKDNLDLNQKKPASESQNNVGSSSQVVAVKKPETESSRLKLVLPAKRAVEDMGQHDDSRVKKINNMVSGIDVASLMRTHAGGLCFGLDEWTVSEVWSTEVDKEEKRELKERIENLKDAHRTLHLQQAQLGADLTKVIVDALRKRQ